MALQLLREHRDGLRRPELEELLDDLIPKDAGHEHPRVRQELLEHRLLHAVRRHLELLLDEARAVLNSTTWPTKSLSWLTPP